MEPVKIKIVPQTIIYNYKEVTICCELMYINGLDFLNTISRHIMFDTGSMIKDPKTKNIADWIMQVHNLYLQCGFKITHMHTDFDF